jgi:hypothetical protein
MLGPRMQFTKSEQKILSPRYERFDKLTLWMGVLAICVSIGLGLYSNYQSGQFQQWLTETELKFEPTTEKETMLKDALIKAQTEQKTYLLKYFELRLLLSSTVLFYVGISFITIYFMKRRFMRLIRKLQSPNDCIQPIAQKTGSG